MSARTPDPRLDALLRDLPPPPPLSADFAARVLAAAAAAPQETRPAHARRAAAPRDRRGRWLRRPLLAGTAALGLIVSSAVAATLAGVPIPQKIAAVFFPEEKAPAPKQAEPPRRAASRPSSPAPAPAVPVQTTEAGNEPDASWYGQSGPWRRLFMAQRIIAERRAMGLPTPHADRIEHRLRRRAELWRQATPEQRAVWLERQQARREARRAALATPEGQAALAAQREQMQRWRQQRQAGIPLTPEQRAARRELIQDMRARGLTRQPLTPEQRAMRQERMQAWRARQEATQPPLTEEQRAARQDRFRQWREARRARWRARAGQSDSSPEIAAEGSHPTGR